MYLYGAYTPSLVVLVLLTCHLAGAGEPPKGEHPANSVDTNGKQLDLVMPGARPETDDSYLCSAFDVEALSGTKEAVHITGFVPDADANRAHHMLLYTCNQPNELPGKVYDCMHHAMCKDANSIMFAWAKNAPPTTLPKNVGFKMDPKERKYLVLQVHYAHPLPDADNTGLSLKYQLTPPTYQAGILLMVTGGQIAPHEEKVHLDINCKLPAEVPLHFFGFRTHAHSLGSVISGYAFNEKSNEYRQIAKGSPQWPQAFYPMKQLQTVKPGEYLAARCTYNSTTRDKVTFIGATAGDEMCNLYMMYFFPPGKAADYLGCGGVQAGNEITEGLPAGNDVAPPRNEVWEAKAHNSGVDTGVTAINYDDLMDTQALMDNKGSTKKAGIEEEDQMAIYNFTMIGAKPTQTDDYLCTALKMKGMSTRKLWIERFSAIANGNRAHHMILSKCKHPIKEDDSIYDCRHHAMCLDQSKIMFAWAKHAEPTKLPPDVGFDIADDDFLVLQVHYAEPLNNPDYSGLQLQFTTREPKYTAGIFLLGRSNLYIPPNTPTTHGDANCKANIPAWIHVFAYRTHAHSFGNVISGYKKGKTGEWSMIAKGNPQWPQAFYPMEKEMIIAPGDTVAARCSYNTTGHDSPVKIGATAGDEMCNLFLMYYTTSKDTEFVVCFDEKDTELNKHLPQGNDEPLPPNPELEMKAHGTTEAAQTNPTTGREGKSLPGSHYSLVPGWPAKETASYLGQVSGVAIDTYGNAVIFHRGDRTWNGNTFKSDNTYGMDKNVPIPQDTVLTVNSSGHIINQWGNNFFFLPHMITIDKQNNVWVTDVAMHQVFKFGPYGGDDKKPLLTLGTKFEPGTDDSHYCKPTSVAVSADTKTFYVSDGYCNSRIIKYSITVTSDGKHAVNKITEWGKTAGVMSISRGPYNFNIPHSLTLAEDKNLICVADRENGRVLCFDTDGNAKKEIQPEGFGGRIFGISYAKQQLYAVSGPEFNPFAPKPVGFILDVESGQIDGTFQVPDGLKNPHDVVVSEDASTIYVVELNPFVTWKLSNGQPSALSGSSSVSSGLPAAGKQPTAAGSSSPQQMILDGAKKLVPTSSGVLWAAVISVPLTILVSCLLAIRKCRKRGRGTMTDGGSRPKNWGLGDILGRSKDGFQPVNTEERDGLVGDDSDSEVEEFSVPAMHA